MRRKRSISMNANGSDLRQLADHVLDHTLASLTGSRVRRASRGRRTGAGWAYTSFSGGGEERRLQIWTRSPDGSTPTLLFESSSIAKTGGGPVWSPDGTRIAFGDAPGGGEPVWLVAQPTEQATPARSTSSGI